MCSARLNFHPPARHPLLRPARSSFAIRQRCHPERSEGSRSPMWHPSHPLPSANAVILSAAKDLVAPRSTPVRSLHLTPHGDSTNPPLKLDRLCLIRYNTLMFN